jgi:hypothetical protein
MNKVNGLSFSSQYLKQLWSDLVAGTIRSLDIIGMIFIHLATIPTLIAAQNGTIDKLPSIDIVLFIWAGLSVWFCRALMQKDTIMTAGIGVGFIIQALLLALLLFK